MDLFTWFLVAHLWGDYALQSEWMAANKAKRWDAALLHGVAYSMPFALVWALPRWFPAWILAANFLSHVLIDRFSLGRRSGFSRDAWAIMSDQALHLTILAVLVGFA